MIRTVRRSREARRRKREVGRQKVIVRQPSGVALIALSADKDPVGRSNRSNVLACARGRSRHK
ncbi:MAG TPA: hypothetical protein VFT26_01375 [Pyrinomonadaceae bacterium]|nr:hypothetical protein [Pyrinomonadaceae bacterium]